MGDLATFTNFIRSATSDSFYYDYLILTYQLHLGSENSSFSYSDIYANIDGENIYSALSLGYPSLIPSHPHPIQKEAIYGSFANWVFLV